MTLFLALRRWGQRARDVSQQRRLEERGDAMVFWCLLLALMLLPLGGLSVDLWHGISVQRALQSAAGDAATAGASGLNVSEYRESGCLVLDPGVAVPLAQANLESQTDIGPLDGADISVAPGGQSISVTLREDVRLTLLSLVEGNKPLVVTASATSAPRGSVSESGCP
jgi:Flp pilus assembly protein TadG